MKSSSKLLISCLLLFILIINMCFAVTISPTELKIKNREDNKNYKFIILVSSQEEGLVDIELKATDKAISISPDKFMLNKGEKKSVRLGFNSGQINKDKDNIIIQPYVNNAPDKNKLLITLEEKKEKINKSNKTIHENKNNIIDEKTKNTIIYSLILIISLIIAGLFGLEIAKSIKINTRIKNIINKQKNKKKLPIDKRIKNIDKKIDKLDKKLKTMTRDVETFYKKSNDWLKTNSKGEISLD